MSPRPLQRAGGNGLHLSATLGDDRGGARQPSKLCQRHLSRCMLITLAIDSDEYGGTSRLGGFAARARLRRCRNIRVTWLT
jgi:hypothetical protein